MSRGKLNELIDGEKPLLIDFHATWCSPCHQLAPAIQSIAEKYSGKLKVIKVDIDKNPAVANKFQIKGVPTLILFRKGNIAWRQSGVVPEGMIEKEVAKVL